MRVVFLWNYCSSFPIGSNRFFLFKGNLSWYIYVSARVSAVSISHEFLQKIVTHIHTNLRQSTTDLCVVPMKGGGGRRGWQFLGNSHQGLEIVASVVREASLPTPAHLEAPRYVRRMSCGEVWGGVRTWVALMTERRQTLKQLYA